MSRKQKEKKARKGGKKNRKHGRCLNKCKKYAERRRRAGTRGHKERKSDNLNGRGLT